MATFKINLTDQGQTTRRRFFSDVIDDYRKITVESIPNYKISRKKPGEQRPKFSSVSNGRDFYYLIEDIKIKDVSLENTVNKTQPTTKIEEKTNKGNI